MCTISSAGFLFLFQQKGHLSLDRDLNFQIHIDTHLEKTDQKLIYKYFCPEETSINLEVCPQFFYAFFIFLQTSHIAI